MLPDPDFDPNRPTNFTVAIIGLLLFVALSVTTGVVVANVLMARELDRLTPESDAPVVVLGAEEQQLCEAYCVGRESSLFVLDRQRHTCVCADGAVYDTGLRRARDPLLTYDLFCNRFDPGLDHWAGR